MEVKGSNPLLDPSLCAENPLASDDPSCRLLKKGSQKEAYGIDRRS